MTLLNFLLLPFPEDPRLVFICFFLSLMSICAAKSGISLFLLLLSHLMGFLFLFFHLTLLQLLS
jgi:hypothetical protein